MSYLSECFSEPNDDKTLLQVVAKVLSAVMHAAAMSALDHHAHNWVLCVKNYGMLCCVVVLARE